MTFPDTQKLRAFITSRPVLRETVKTEFHADVKETKQQPESKGRKKEQ